MTCSNFSLKHTQSSRDWHGGSRIYILLAIAPSSDWCRIPIESGYHGGMDPTKDYIYPQHRPLTTTAGDCVALT